MVWLFFVASVLANTHCPPPPPPPSPSILLLSSGEVVNSGCLQYVLPPGRCATSESAGLFGCFDSYQADPGSGTIFCFDGDVVHYNDGECNWILETGYPDPRVDPFLAVFKALRISKPSWYNFTASLYKDAWTFCFGMHGCCMASIKDTSCTTSDGINLALSPSPSFHSTQVGINAEMWFTIMMTNESFGFANLYSNSGCGGSVWWSVGVEAGY